MYLHIVLLWRELAVVTTTVYHDCRHEKTHNLLEVFYLLCNKHTSHRQLYLSRAWRVRHWCNLITSVFPQGVIYPLTLSSQKQIIVDPLAFSEERFRPSLEERLESIISGAALMADSSCTRDDRRERIVAECNSVRQALQDLLSEYMGNVSVLPCFNLQFKSKFVSFKDTHH